MLRRFVADRKRILGRYRPLRDSIGEGRSLYELQDECLGAVDVLQPVDRCNVRMVERCEHLRFPLEAGESIGVQSETVGENLQSGTSRPSLESRAR